jgi:hypothetical protein
VAILPIVLYNEKGSRITNFKLSGGPVNRIVLIHYIVYQLLLFLNKKEYTFIEVLQYLAFTRLLYVNSYSMPLF